MQLTNTLRRSLLRESEQEIFSYEKISRERKTLMARLLLFRRMSEQ
jgi:hypothetical protein